MLPIVNWSGSGLVHEAAADSVCRAHAGKLDMKPRIPWIIESTSGPVLLWNDGSLWAASLRSFIQPSACECSIFE